MKMRVEMSLRKIAFAAVVGALYAVLTMINPIAYGPVQCRVSEALCVLPFYFPFSAWGLFVGCIVANLISAYGALDVVFGSIATLAAALCTARIGRSGAGGVARKAAACLPPVLLNAVVVGGVIAFSSATFSPVFWPAFLSNALTVGLGEFAAMYAFGLPLLVLLPKSGVFKSLSALYEG